jgi:hypothetical protein
VVDAFRLVTPGQAEQEWLVVADALGRLAALPDTDRSQLPENVQRELAYHEIGGARKSRRIEASELFLFNLQLVEQPVPSPGVDDPVYLYGTLSGPFPAGAESPVVEGQLTATRTDLLDGLVQGLGYAFRYPGNGGASGEHAHCYHLPLPGDREEELRAGRGVVLAYPLLPTEFFLTDPSNEIIVRQLWYDLLKALQDDLRCEIADHPLCGVTLPVPSRHLLEQRLMSEGYEIQGDQAIRKRGDEAGFRKLLNHVLDALSCETLPLPPEGRTEDFQAISRAALERLPGFPPPRTVALRQRLNPTQPGATFRVSNPVPAPQPRIPAPAVTSQTSVPPRAIPLRRRDADDWMKDFTATPRPPGAAPPRLSGPSAPSPPRGARKGQPDWMNDFAAPEEPSEGPAAPDKKASDWTGDFH